MNDDRTNAQKYQDWLDIVNTVWAKGWTHYDEWIFCSPSGTKHDLSAADLNQLDRIESENLLAA